MHLTHRIAAGILFAGLAPIAAAQNAPAAHPALEAAIDQLAVTRRYDEAVISPDGKWVAWVESLPATKDAPSQGSAIYVAPVAAGPATKAGAKGAAAKSAAAAAPAPQRITAVSGDAPHDEHGVSWSPDGKSLAFLSDAADAGQLQLYVAPVAGGTARQLTKLKGYLATPLWSPDGQTVAILFTENAARASGPLQPRTPDVGVVEDHFFEQRLTIVNVASGDVHQLSPADLYVYEYDWSPDGKRFITTAAHGEGDDNWYIAELYTVDAASGETRSILKPSMQIAVPRWSPDGKQVAFIGGIMSDEGIASGDIFVVDAGGGTPRNITPGMKGSAYWLAWLPTGRVYFVAAREKSCGSKA